MYSGLEVRKAIILYDKLRSFRKVAQKLNIGKSTIHRWWNVLEKRVFKNRKKRCILPRKFKTLDKDVLNIVLGSSKTSILEIQKDLPYRVSISTIARSLKRQKIRAKKERCVVIPNPKKLLEKKEAFKNLVELENISIHQVVCLDEIGFSNLSNNIKIYSHIRCTKKRELKARLKKSSLAAISCDELLTFQVQDKAFKSSSFTAFLKESLVPILRDHHKYILLDNVSFHHNNEAIKVLLDHDLKPLFIPPYSPQYNPIEEFFSLVKKHFRSCLVSGMEFSHAISESFKKLKIHKEMSHFYNHSQHFWLRNDMMDGSSKT